MNALLEELSKSLPDAHEAAQVTTAAGVWMTAAIGVAIGLGRLGVAAIAVVFAWFVVAIVVKAEPHPRSD